MTIRCDSHRFIVVRFNREAFLAILDRSEYPNRTAFARAVGISAGTLHDITDDPPRRHPSPDLIRRLARELKVPLPALLLNPEEVAS